MWLRKLCAWFDGFAWRTVRVSQGWLTELEYKADPEPDRANFAACDYAIKRNGLLVKEGSFARK